MSKYHVPVLLQKVVENSNLKSGFSYIDCTLGGGGHFIELLNRLNEDGVAIGLDQDKDAIHEVQKNLLESGFMIVEEDDEYRLLEKSKLRVYLVNSNFKNLDKILKVIGINRVDYILADLGVSSHQLDSPTRGFAFKENQDLDMRMNQDDLGATAKDLVNGLYENELEKAIRIYGEEKYSKLIAKEIVEYRKTKEIKTTTDLYNIVQKAVPYKDSNYLRGSAQRVFQALRILLNDELAALHELLDQALDKLTTKSILAVISYHSLEDRIVKDFIKNNKEKVNYDSIIYPDEDEIRSNPRSRSAKLRIVEIK